MSFRRLRDSILEKILSPEEQQIKVLDSNFALFYEPEVLNLMFIVCSNPAFSMMFFHPKVCMW